MPAETYDALQLTHIAHGGEAIGQDEDKWVFVPYAIPGETVRAAQEESGRKWARARLLNVITPSADRVEPVCPHFGPAGCDNCQWQHIRYQRQLALKQEIVADQLRRLGGEPDPPVRPTLTAGEPFAYRRRIYLAANEASVLGLPQRGRDVIFPVEQCPLWSPALADLVEALAVDLPGLRGVDLRVGEDGDEAMVILHGRGELPELTVDLPVSVVWKPARGAAIPLVGEPFLTAKIGGRPFRFAAESDYPAHPAGRGRLIETAHDLLALAGNERLLELFGGVGLFSLSWQSEVSEVILVEPGAAAAEDAAWNAGDADNVTIYEGPIREVVRSLAEPVDSVLLSPPRQGVGRETVAALGRLQPRRILYVADDPAMLAREAAFFRQEGYRLATVQPVDLRPQTARVHVLGLWEK